MIAHASEDVEILVLLVGGGSLTALGISRVRYGSDWLDPWLIATKALFATALFIIAVFEHTAIRCWWQGSPIVTSTFLASSAALGATAWLRTRRAQPSLVDLNLAESNAQQPSAARIYSWPLAIWGAVNLFLLLYSLLR